jgi:hypothetical protein
MYTPLPENFDSLNSAQKNEEALRAGYTGYNDYLDQKNRNITGQGTIGISGQAPQTGMPGTGTGAINFAQPTLNLPDLYKNLMGKSGISTLEQDLSTKQKAYNDVISKINDNPWLSEANRVGKISKLSTDYENSIAGLKTDVATKKADIETQLNLETKQFDINSEQATQALNQFNSLLSSGALDNASPEDIANFTRATGMSSSMIQSAINASKEAKKKDVPTSVIDFDDGTNVGFAIINTQTGEIISKQTVATSEPKKSTGSGSDGLTDTQSRAVTSIARKALTEVDTNEDKALSLPEYQQAVEKIMTEAGVDFKTADDYATSAFNDLGYKTWQWSQYK